ncbi:hypothetical protein [Edaphobacter albus]|uniref:hypothetical protein n=1 Tax=Edaphobacter sp. 4G125 TaxID=2763071 RepID=UPI001645BA93|nr:hypothetical protein [Edaphobacter sp. 4G125]QNI36124.1 hypothetical protein H7846_14135 [Edaphobacter sp. 4G125]
MRTGEIIRAELLYPVYVDNQIGLKEKTILLGDVTELHKDTARRTHARINGDFTPFHTPVVHFSQIVLENGLAIPLDAGPAIDGAPVLRLNAPAPRKGGFIRRQWETGMQIAHDQISVFTAPEKGDRLLQFVYHQLPYHPERIEDGTSWTIETTEPITIPAQSLQTPPPAISPTAPDTGRSTWMMEAYLRQPLSSATAKTGQPIQAMVAEPIYNRDHTIAIPQGALLMGAVTQARPARSFARAGVLSFDFKQITLPGGTSQNVQSALTGVDAASGANLAMDSEGRVKPKPQDKVVVPLILALLATRPLDEDGGLQAGRNFVGANGFGLAGNIIALATGSAKVSAGIGAYGTAVSLYRRWFARGNDVVFAKNTRIVVEATPRGSSVLKPQHR